MRCLVLVFIAILAVGCKPKVGATCKIDKKEVCNEKTALVCHSNSWQEMACRGPKGCIAGDEAECDQSVARAGDICNVENNVTCSEDKKASLVCKDKKWTLEMVCGGPLGCALSTNDKKLECDATIAKEAEKCADENTASCSSDKKARLICRGGKYALSGQCRGDLGCRFIGGKVDCDDSLAVVGDLCSQAGHYACSVDGKSVVKCDGTKFALDEACKNRKVCKLSGDKVGCL
jgi:hypothetical protein